MGNVDVRSYISGYVDGEGCFSIGFVKQPDRGKRKGYTTGYQVAHEFCVTQGERSLASLKELKDFFGVGQVIINRRYDNHREHLYRFVVRKRQDLLEVIIPFFQQYPLRTAKKKDFQKFVQCVRMIRDGIHLTPEGLIQIILIAQTMNRRKSRAEIIRILRDYTPNTDLNDREMYILSQLNKGEDIVQAT